jgi:hypothetical protein
MVWCRYFKNAARIPKNDICCRKLRSFVAANCWCHVGPKSTSFRAFKCTECQTFFKVKRYLCIHKATMPLYIILCCFIDHFFAKLQKWFFQGPMSRFKKKNILAEKIGKILAFLTRN